MKEGGISNGPADFRSRPNTVAYRRWDSPYIAGLFFVASSEHAIAYAEHLHDALEIMWVRSGTAQLTCCGRSYPMRAGDAVVIAPDAVHAGGSRSGSSFSFTTLHLPRAVLDELSGAAGREPESLPRAPVLLFDGAHAAALYHSLVDGLPACVSRADQISCLQEDLGRLLDAALPGSPVASAPNQHPGIQRVRSLITGSFSEHIDLDSLASEAGLHQRYLISLFKEVTGIPPHQYQIAMRVEYARSLLNKDMPLSRIASAAGFADQSHLNRFFKRTYRMTPGLFRERTRRL